MTRVIPELSVFEDARARIEGHVVRTPAIFLRKRGIAPGSRAVRDGVVDTPALDARLTHDLLLKLECLQVTGSFKARGAVNKVLSLPRESARRGIVTASGGNHGVAVAYAGGAIDAPTTVFLPGRAPASKAARIERWGASVVRVGDVWDDAHEAALAHAAREGTTYIHPFADPDVVAGQGTVALEVLDVAPETDAFVVAIGGGGLAAGVAAAAKRRQPGVRVIGVEPVGAPTLYESVRANRVVELPSIDTAAGTLAPRRSDEYNLAIIRDTVDDIVLVTDEEMREAARFLLAEVGIGAELSGAASVAALIAGKIDLAGALAPCALVCGAGADARS